MCSLLGFALNWIFNFSTSTEKHWKNRSILVQKMSLYNFAQKKVQFFRILLPKSSVLPVKIFHAKKSEKNWQKWHSPDHFQLKFSDQFFYWIHFKFKKCFEIRCPMWIKMWNVRVNAQSILKQNFKAICFISSSFLLHSTTNYSFSCFDSGLWQRIFSHSPHDNY